MDNWEHIRAYSCSGKGIVDGWRFVSFDGRVKCRLIPLRRDRRWSLNIVIELGGRKMSFVETVRDADLGAAQRYAEEAAMKFLRDAKADLLAASSIIAGTPTKRTIQKRCTAVEAVNG